MGSGTHLKHSQNKYGIKNFEKKVLEIFVTPEIMFQYEAILVNEEFVKRSDTYNINVGGCGGFSYINENDLNYKFNSEDRLLGQTRSKQVLSVLRKDKIWSENFSKIRSQKMLSFYLNGGVTFKGKTHTKETKKKMSESHKGKHEGIKNSQYGTIWIYSLEEKTSKKIKKEELPEYIDLGWLKGRKMKFD